MKLKDWLQVRKVTQRELAAKVGIAQPSLSLFCTGRGYPTAETMRRIAIATEGEVMPNDFFDGLVFERKAA